MYINRLSFDLLCWKSTETSKYWYRLKRILLHVVHYFPGGSNYAIARCVSFAQITWSIGWKQR